jgi:hypothetical protein
MGFVSPLSSHLNRTSCFSSRQASCFLIHPNRFDATGYKAARLSRSACRSMRLLKLPLPSTIATNGLALARIARVFCSGVRSPISIIDEPVGDRLTRRSRSALLTQLACSHVSSGPSSTHSPAPPFCRACKTMRNSARACARARERRKPGSNPRAQNGSSSLGQAPPEAFLSVWAVPFPACGKR